MVAPNPDPPPLSARDFRITLTGLIIALALSSLDQNIVGTALPQIVGSLGGLAHLSWVVTAFLLTSTVTAPLYGKLSDMYGRRPLFLAAIGIFLAGSALCGLAQSMIQLVMYRGLQGVGAGGLLVLAQTTIGDLVAPRERGRYQGWFSGVFALCSVAGPLLGGVITTALSWRWVFYVNLPLGIPALAMLAYGLRRPHRAVHHRIDYAGTVLLVTGTSCLLLLLTWGGTSYGWTSPVILGLGGAAAALLLGLWAQERRAAEPVLPPDLFGNPTFVIAAGTIGLSIMALFATLVFLPLYLQLVVGATPAAAGLMLAPVMGGVIVSSIGGGRFVSATGRYKLLPVLGLGAASLALGAIAWATSTAAPVAFIEWALVVVGLGVGLVLPTLIVAIQSAVPRSELGVATASAAFVRSLGGALGVALCGAVMGFGLRVAGGGEARGVDPAALRSLDQIATLPAAQRAWVVAAYRHAIGATFGCGAVVAAAGFVLVLFLVERPLRSGPAQPAAAAGGPGGEPEVPAATPAAFE
jgi:EmrB/QacA subfamily drug resistance transporter